MKWVKRFARDFLSYTALLLVVIFMMSADTRVPFTTLLLKWDWPLTVANIVLAVFFRWLMFGFFRKKKSASGPA
jgi:uncharacterized integral membrane protein